MEKLELTAKKIYNRLIEQNQLSELNYCELPEEEAVLISYCKFYCNSHHLKYNMFQIADVAEFIKLWTKQKRRKFTKSEII